MITENDHLAHAIDLATKLWPEAAGERATLLRRIIDEGITLVEEQTHHNIELRQAAIHSLSGSMSGTWPANWRRELVEEWPE